MERYSFDAPWRDAVGVGGYDTGEWASFVHTVLGDMRERLRPSDHPDRVFEVSVEAAEARAQGWEDGASAPSAA